MLPLLIGLFSLSSKKDFAEKHLVSFSFTTGALQKQLYDINRYRLQHPLICFLVSLSLEHICRVRTNTHRLHHRDLVI
jgi:hypothetical protein